MHRSALFTTLAVFAPLCLHCGEPTREKSPTVAQASTPPRAPVVQSSALREDDDEAVVRDPVAAQKRLDGIKAKLERQTAEAFLESATSADAAQNFKEARDAYRGLFLYHPEHERAAAAVELATKASFRLNEHSDGLEFFEDALTLVKGQVAEARLFRLLGNTYLTVPHFGTEKAGTLHRGRYDQGIFRYTYDTDRKTAVRHLESSRSLYTKLLASPADAGLDKAELERERIETQFDLVTALSRFTPYDGSWYYWYQAWNDVQDDLEDEHGADERAGRWGRYDMLYRAQPRGVAVNEEGEVIFTARPEAYDARLDTTAKIKFLLHEIDGLDATAERNLAARAAFQQALIFESRHGTGRLRRLASWWWMGKTPFKATIDETPLYELDDDQVLGLVATHVGRYRLPDDESTIAILDQLLESHPSSDVIDEAYLARGAFYQSRQQYKRAIAAYTKYLEDHPKGEKVADARTRIDEIKRSAATVGQTGVQATGTSPRMEIEHRNITTIYASAQRTNLEKAVSKFKADWKAGRESSYAPSNLPYRLYHEESYVKELALGSPETFDLKVDDDGTHRFTKSTLDLPIDGDGLWVVTLYSDAERTARLGRGIVAQTTLAIVEKSATDGPMIWVVDARTGQPAANAEVRVFEHWRSYDGGKSQLHHAAFTRTTGRDGLVKLPRVNRQRVISAKHGNHYALAGQGYYWYHSPSRLQDGDVGLVFTDRPVYRPDHTARMRVWVRRRSGGVYQPAKAVQRIGVRITDPKGAIAYEGEAALTGAGGGSFQYKLPNDAPLGLYRVQVRADHRWLNAGGNQFRVEEYKAPEFEVDVSLGDGPAKLGETIPVKIKATYLFGGPVVGAKIAYKIFRSDYDHRYVASGPWDWLYGAGYGRCYYAYPWFAWWGDWGPRAWAWYPWWGPAPEPRRELVKEGKGVLDADGTITADIDTTRAKQLYGDKDQRFTVEADVVDSTRRTISGGGDVIATRHPFFVSTETDRGYYEVGQTVSVGATLQTFDGDPITKKSGRFEIAAVRFSGTNGDDVTERPVFDESATTDEQGRVRAKWDVEKPGQYRLSFTTSDDDGTTIVGSSVLWVWGAAMDSSAVRFNHLQVITDRRTYAIGETAKLLISSEVENAKVLFSAFVDGGAMEKPRVLQLKGKTQVVEIEITERHSPNFFVEAVVVGDGKISEEVRELFVPPPDSGLNIELEPSASEFRAGKKGKLVIKTTTLDGLPVSADVAVSVFDRAVLYIQPELTPDIRKTFWGQKRAHRLASASNLRQRLGPFEHPSRPDDHANTMLLRAQNEVSAFGATGTGRGGGGLGGRGSLARADDKEREVLGDSRDSDLPKGDKAAAASPAREKSKVGSKDAPAPPPPPGQTTPATARVRKNFADTAAWRIVQTNKQGRAEIDWTFPDNLTTWRIKAVGMTEDTRVGQASTSVITTKKLLVQLQAPRFFRERDRVAITAVVHNRLPDDQKVTVKLDVTETLLQRDGPAEQVVDVAAGGSERVDFWVNVRGEGEAKVRVSALTSVESDAKELYFPVLVHGLTKTDAATGSIPFGDGPAEASIVMRVPEERRTESTELVVRAAPSLAMAMIDALPFLLEYPYGCTEQTMSRFVPAAVAKKTLQQAGGLDLAQIKKIRASLNPQALDAKDAAYDERRAHEYRRFFENPVYDDRTMNRIIRAGLARIAKLQNSDGGWGWWGSDNSSPYTTAYVMYGLAEARDADVAIPAALMSSGITALERAVSRELGRHRDDDWVSDTDAFMAYVLGRFNKPSAELLDRLYERRVRLSVYGKSLLAMALWDGGRKDDARVALRNASQFLKSDDENDTSWVDTNRNGWWYWYNSDIESNATFLRALVQIRPDDKRAPRLIKWLLNNRKNGWYWRSTRDTAIVISSFGAYLRARRVTDTNYDLDILVDGEVKKSVHIDRTNLLTFDGELRLKGAEIGGGEHTITFRRRGKGAVFFNTYLTYFTLEEDVPASGLEIKVERKYYRLVRSDREHEIHDQKGQAQQMREVAYQKVPLASGDHVESGDLLLVQLELESKNDYTFLAFEDPKPAGAEPVAVRSGTTYGEAVANMELRDDRVVFFLSHLAQGKLHLEYRLRAEIPGVFHTMPTRGFAMYAPELRATSSEIRIAIDDPN